MSIRVSAPRLPRQIALALAFCGLAGGAMAQPGAPAGPVPVELLTSRRAALARELGAGVALIAAAQPRGAESYPHDSDYREHGDFFYLTGLEAPGAMLVIAAGESTLYLPSRDAQQERWTGPRPGPDTATAAITGIARVRSLDRLEVDLQPVLARADTLYAFLARAGTPACAGLALRANRCAPVLRHTDPGDVIVRDLRPFLTRLRTTKDADELRRLRRAIDLTAAAHRAALDSLRAGLWEYELEAVIEYTFRRGGAERVGFPSIVGSGPNSTVLHYDRNRRRMQAGDLVVVDVGAEWGYYTADITRTYPVSGRFSPRQRALYELVLGAQQAAIDAVRPGVTASELTRIAREHLRKRSGDLCGERTCDEYFVHGLSHHIGLDVHDPGAGGPLRAGMVFTIEPGIYLVEEGLGIRIEDDVLVTESGHELLSAGAPRSAEEIERALARASRARGLHP